MASGKFSSCTLLIEKISRSTWKFPACLYESIGRVKPIPMWSFIPSTNFASDRHRNICNIRIRNKRQDYHCQSLPFNGWMSRFTRLITLQIRWKLSPVPMATIGLYGRGLCINVAHTARTLTAVPEPTIRANSHRLGPLTTLSTGEKSSALLRRHGQP